MPVYTKPRQKKPNELDILRKMYQQVNMIEQELLYRPNLIMLEHTTTLKQLHKQLAQMIKDSKPYLRSNNV